MTADVLVVGAGSAGCVVAQRLSRNRSVVLVEAGPRVPTGDDAYRLDRMALGSPASPSPEARWYTASPPVVRGRAVGGSSLVNGGYFLRTRREDFAGWGGPFTAEAIGAAYDELDGGGAGGTMTVRRQGDAEVPPLVRALERRWTAAPAEPWPGIGAQRVPVNGAGGRRRTAAQAYLDPVSDRSTLTVRADSPVAALLVDTGREAEPRVVGVRLASGEELHAGEVILCAGTLGSAELVLASGLVGESLPVYEHRETLVRYREHESAPSSVLLPSVVHTSDCAEIRCYAGDFARFIVGVPPSTPVIGVGEMRPAQAGILRWNEDHLDLGLAPIGDLSGAVASVVETLSSPAMAGFVVEGSVTVDPAEGTSQHAWGSLVMGERTDWLGAVDGVAGLRVIDGSILPNVSSGPHATIMMAALVIADALS